MQIDLRDIVDYHVLTCIEHTIKRHVNNCVNNSCVDSVKTAVASTVFNSSVETYICSGVLKCVNEFVDERLE